MNRLRSGTSTSSDEIQIPSSAKVTEREKERERERGGGGGGGGGGEGGGGREGDGHNAHQTLDSSQSDKFVITARFILAQSIITGGYVGRLPHHITATSLLD